MTEELHRLPYEYGVEVLRTEVGSTLHGISIGNDDLDQMGVCVERPEYVIGLEHFEQYIFRSASVREGIRDAKSKPGDLDLTVYSLRKWLRLAMKGNPSVLLLLFAPESRWAVGSALAHDLQAQAPLIVSRRAGGAFLGYIQAQKQRYLRERGIASIPDRGDKDGKYLAHMVRLGMQGVELMETGQMTLPMRPLQAEYCRDVRRGSIDPNDVLNRVGEIEKQLRDLQHDSPLAEEPDRETLGNWLIDTYYETWQSRDLI